MAWFEPVKMLMHTCLPCLWSLFYIHLTTSGTPKIISHEFMLNIRKFDIQCSIATGINKVLNGSFGFHQVDTIVVNILTHVPIHVMHAAF